MRREIPVFRADGGINQEAPLALLSIMTNPNEATAARQFSEVLRIENEAQLGGGSTAASEVSEFVVGRYTKRKNRGDVAGYVVLFMADIEAAGERASLTRAQIVTEAFLGDVDAEFKAGMPQNLRDVRKHFSHYSDVAHLWAAKIHFPEKWVALPSSFSALIDFLSHARLLEQVMRRNLDAQTRWEPWRVPSSIPCPQGGYKGGSLKAEYLALARAHHDRRGA